MTDPSAALTVLSGPSGVGKSTVIAALLRAHPQIWPSVSVTTRVPRPGEVDGVNYHFIDSVEFDRLVADGDLLEHARFAGHRYGTPRAPVAEKLAAGVPVLLEIELDGARQVRGTVPGANFIFLAPPSWEDLVGRLSRRGTESPAVMTRRLARARLELDAAGEFDHVIPNTTVEDAVSALVDCMGLSASTPQ